MYQKFINAVERTKACFYDSYSMALDYWMYREPELEEYPDVEMDFSDALLLLKAGDKISRMGWGHTDIIVYIFIADEDIAVLYGTKINMVTADHHLIPWLPTQEDIMADDWVPIITD